MVDDKYSRHIRRLESMIGELQKQVTTLEAVLFTNPAGEDLDMACNNIHNVQRITPCTSPTAFRPYSVVISNGRLEFEADTTLPANTEGTITQLARIEMADNSMTMVGDEIGFSNGVVLDGVNTIFPSAVFGDMLIGSNDVPVTIKGNPLNLQGLTASGAASMRIRNTTNDPPTESDNNGSIAMTTSGGLYKRTGGSWLDVSNDTDAIHDNVSGEINALTAKTHTTSPALDLFDNILIEDYDDSFSKKRTNVLAIGRTIDLLPYVVQDNNASGTQNASSTTITVNLDTEVIAHNNYSLASDVITVSAAGVYLVATRVTVDTSANQTVGRGDLHSWLEVDSGSGFAERLNTRNACYWRELGAHVTAGGTTFVELAADDDLRLRCQMNGTDTWPLQNRESSLSLMRVSP